jgi:hypothetical protein
VHGIGNVRNAKIYVSCLVTESNNRADLLVSCVGLSSNVHLATLAEEKCQQSTNTSVSP